jgi:hypothetical protein
MVKVYNREIYNKKLDRKHYEIYHHYINERVKYLIGEGILDREYSMILLDGTMYKVVDNFHFMELSRFLVPVGGLEMIDYKDNLVDLVLDATLRTGEIFEETDLVFHNGVFYNDGNVVKTVYDLETSGVEYNLFDLMQGITREQLNYLVWDYYSRDFQRYITKDVCLNIDRWY